MFDIGWSELAVIAVVALIVIGPKDLPRVLYTAGKMAGKARATLRELQQGIEDIGREAELDELRKTIDATRDFDVNKQGGKKVRSAVDPDREIEAAFDMEQERPRRAPDEVSATRELPPAPEDLPPPLPAPTAAAPAVPPPEPAPTRPATASQAGDDTSADRR